MKSVWSVMQVFSHEKNEVILGFVVVLPFFEVINLNGCWGRGNPGSKDSQTLVLNFSSLSVISG